jgi:WD40 repeat protein
MASSDAFFIPGGTLPVDADSYVARRADDELYQGIQAGEFCYILTSRQMGKSSLVARTAERLRAEGVHVASLDLTDIGKPQGDAADEKWYYGIAHNITGELKLDLDLLAWWEKRFKLAAVQRFTDFIREVVLGRTSGRVVIFIDEIDNTLGLPFADDFFAAIRACYNHRPRRPRYEDLTFVLVGVASPSDLIADTTRTPFNIGRRIELTDFTAEEAKPLASGLSQNGCDGDVILTHILDWTGGHPYLTQALCAFVGAEPPGEPPGVMVNYIVEREFLASGADKEERNLQFVRNYLTSQPRRARRLLPLYERIRRGQPVADDPRSRDHIELKLSGVVKADVHNRLIVRNRIYERVFNLDWIKAAIPKDPVRLRAIRAAATAVALLLLSPVFWYEVVYPQQLVTTLTRALEDFRLAQTAYDTLRRIPFYQRRADELWGQFNLRRMDHALTLDTQPNRGPEVYSLVNDARARLDGLTTLPEYAAEGTTKRSQFFERRAIRSASREQREEALLWWLKTLTVLPSSEKPRRAASDLIGADYARLEKTVRMRGAHPGTREGYRTVSESEWFAVLRGLSFLSGHTALSLDNRRLAGALGESVEVWDLDRPGAKPLLLQSKDFVGAVAFSPDGRHLAGAGADRTVPRGIMMWDLDHPDREPTTLPRPKGSIEAIAFSPDGRRLAGAGADGAAPRGVVWMWDLDRPDREPTALPRPKGSVEAIAFSPDGRRLAGAGDGVGIWELDRPGTDPLDLHPNLTLRAVAFSPDGRRLAATGVFHLLEWDLDRPGADPLRLLTFDDFASVAFLGGRRLACGGLGILRGGGDVTVWDLDRPNAHSLQLRVPEQVVSSRVFSPEDHRLISAGFDKDRGPVVRVWDLDRPGAEEHAAGVLSDRVLPLVLSPDGSRLAGFAIDDLTYTGGSTFRVWDLDRPGANPLVLRGLGISLSSVVPSRQPGISVTCVFSPDGRRLAGAGRLGLVRVWDLDRPRDEPLTLEWPGGVINAAAFSPDGRRLAGAGTDRASRGMVMIWNLDQQGLDPLIMRSPEQSVDAVAFSPNGRRLAGGGGGVVQIWDLARAGADPLTLQSPEGSINSLAFSREGSRLVSSSYQGPDRSSLCIWDLTRSGAEPLVPLKSTSVIYAVAFSPDDDSVFTATSKWAHLARLNGTNLVPHASRLLPGDYLARLNGTNLVPHASRLLPGDYPYWSRSAFRFLDATGERLQVLVRPNLYSTSPITVRFDEFDASPIEGDPEQLLADWQKKLALRISNNGEIIPAE